MPRRARSLAPLLLLACNGPGAADSGAEASEGTTAAATTGEPEPYEPVQGNAFPWALESTDLLCDDGQDNDDNGYADCEDYACSRNPSVSVCGAAAVYEASAELCGNGRDDDGDGAADCGDPDCFKNPFHAVCDKPRSDACGARDGDGDGLVGCEDLDCALDLEACPPAAGSLRVLFDQTADETAGAGPNSDWVIDPWGRLPAPSNPTSAAQWHGALSSFGYALYERGHRLENLVAWDGRLSHGDASNPQDLSRYDVLVVYEPSRRLSRVEQDAIVNFVRGGGGLLAVSNHVSADRDGNGWSAPEVWNDLFDHNSVQVDPFGFRFDEVDVDVTQPISNVLAPAHPVVAGVARLGYYTGCTARLTGGNPGAVGLVVHDDDPARLVVGPAEVGSGRVVFVTDSAMGGDGTDAHGNRLLDHDAWNDPALDNRALLANAVQWLGAGK